MAYTTGSTTSSGGNVTLRIEAGYDSVSRSGNTVTATILGRMGMGKNITGTTTYSTNQFGIWIPSGGTKYSVKASGTRSVADTWYNASQSMSWNVNPTDTSVYVTLGFGWNGSTSSEGNWLGVTVPFSVASYWNDINAYQPGSSAQSGLIFDLTTSDGGVWYNLTNEPSDFTKAYGTTATISNIRPNITGAHYSSNNVTGTAASSFSWTFNTANWACEMYSAWNTYTIAYNANVGSGSPSSQTKTYVTNITLSSTIPTRQYYTFLGWSTSSSATTASYTAGSVLSSDLTTSNGVTVTLYAVWKPNSPSDLALSRTNSTINSISLSASASGVTMTNYTIYYKISSDTAYSSLNLGTSSTGTITNLSSDTDYSIYFTVTNAGGTTTSSTYTFSTLLNEPTITTPVVSNLLPFTCTISATGSITPSRALTYSFSKDGGNTWTAYQSSNLYDWTGLTEETSYDMRVRVKATHIGTNAIDTTNSSSLSITTPADQAKIRLKKEGSWIQGKTYFKKDGLWIKAKKIYIKKDGVWVIGKND